MFVYAYACVCVCVCVSVCVCVCVCGPCKQNRKSQNFLTGLDHLPLPSLSLPTLQSNTHMYQYIIHTSGVEPNLLCSVSSNLGLRMFVTS